MVALNWERRVLPHGAVAVRLLVAAALTAGWFLLVYRVPEVSAFVNGVGIVRIAIHIAILAGLWLGLGLAGFSPEVRLRAWLAIAIPLTIWLAMIWVVAVAGVF